MKELNWNNNIPIHLQVALPVVSDSVCDAALQSFSVKDSMICAGFREGQKDACIVNISISVFLNRVHLDLAKI